MDAKRWYEKLHSHCVHNVYIKPQRKTGFSELTTKRRAKVFHPHICRYISIYRSSGNSSRDLSEAGDGEREQGSQRLSEADDDGGLHLAPSGDQAAATVLPLAT
ncbi:unnamed protein product [Musa acuminata subsp. burmannicoides]